MLLRRVQTQAFHHGIDACKLYVSAQSRRTSALFKFSSLFLAGTFQGCGNSDSSDDFKFDANDYY
ncbi:hypothetical protein C8Q70DRAFT_962365 [Cubamyces menziesii]|nr:hypothetical protein C8Q70DRAFT_962365 [Cubamyces menziesii]